MTWTAEQARDAIARALMASNLPIEVIASRLEGGDVIIEFAAHDRPGCRYAFRYAVHHDGDPAHVDVLGHLACFNLQEEIEAADRGLPDCRPGDLVWVDV